MPSASLYEQIVTGEAATRGIGYVLMQRVLGSDAMSTWISGNGDVAAYASPVASAMTIATGLAMLLLPIMGLYIVVTGLLKQERSGQAWNWKTLPMRMGMGAIFAAPITPSGMALVQVLVVAIGLFGNATGNLAADAMVKKIYSPEVSVSTETPPPSDGQSAAQAFQSITARAVCIQSAQAAGLDQNGTQGSDTNDVQNLCGKMQIMANSTAATAQGVPSGGSGTSYDLDCSQSKYPATCQQLQQINADYAQKIQGAIAGGAVSDEQLQQFATDYQTAVSNVFGQTQTSLKQGAIDATSKLGWLGMGNFWSQLSKSSAQLDQYVYASSESNFTLDQIPAAADSYRGVFDQTKIAWDKAKIAVSNTSGLGALWAGAKGTGSVIGNGVAGLGTGAATLVDMAGQSAVKRAMFGLDTGGANDPFAVPAMDALNRLGMLLGVTGTIFDSASNSLVKESKKNEDTPIFSGGGGIGAFKDGVKALAEKMASTSGMLLHVASFALYMSALFHTAILPMLPNVFNIIMAGEWMMWLVVATVAGPLWGVMHVMPGGGDEMVNQRTFHGWGLMGFIALYPTITVIGYGASIMLFNILIPAAAYMLCAYLPDGFVNASMYIFFGLPMIGFIMAMLSWLTLSLILQLPGLMSGWIGIRPESWFTSQATGQVGAVVPSGNVIQQAGALGTQQHQLGSGRNFFSDGKNGINNGSVVSRLAGLFRK